jgi:hypothetical protein
MGESARGGHWKLGMPGAPPNFTRLASARDLLTTVGMRIIALAGVLALAFVETSHAAPARPAVHVTLDAAGLAPAERTGHVNAIRTAMADAISATGVDAKALDVSVTRLSYATVGTDVEICVEIKVIVSTTANQIQSFASGHARLLVPRRSFRPDQLPQLRQAVVHDAIDALRRRIRALRPARPVA